MKNKWKIVKNLLELIGLIIVLICVIWGLIIMIF